MNNKVFISGKVTGDKSYPQKFEAAAVVVKKFEFFDKYGAEAAKHDNFGFEPVEPTALTFHGLPLRYYRWSSCMVICLWHLTWCSYVYMLRDWQDSRGAQIEHRWAKFLRKRIIYQAEEGGRKAWER